MAYIFSFMNAKSAFFVTKDQFSKQYLASDRDHGIIIHEVSTF